MGTGLSLLHGAHALLGAAECEQVNRLMAADESPELSKVGNGVEREGAALPASGRGGSS